MKFKHVVLLLALVGVVAFSGYTNPDVKKSPPDVAAIVHNDLVCDVVYTLQLSVPEITAGNAALISFASCTATAPVIIAQAPDPFLKIDRPPYEENSRWCSLKPLKSKVILPGKVPLEPSAREMRT